MITQCPAMKMLRPHSPCIAKMPHNNSSFTFCKATSIPNLRGDEGRELAGAIMLEGCELAGGSEGREQGASWPAPSRGVSWAAPFERRTERWPASTR